MKSAVRREAVPCAGRARHSKVSSTDRSPASISRKRYEIRPKLLLMISRKLYMGFQLTPKSMTLDDLELDGGRPSFTKYLN